MGELAALTAALFWAVASTAFADIGRHTPAVHLNLIKGGLAILLMGIVLLAGGMLNISSISYISFISITPYGWVLLITSGIIGIAFGDSAYFACLKRLGPQKGLMLESTAPILAALMALLLYDEHLAPSSWAGISLTTFGVIVVIRYSTGASYYQNSLSGIFLGLSAAFGQAAGIVLSRMALDGENIEPLAAGLIRLTAGLLALFIFTTCSQAISGSTNNILSLRASLTAIRNKQLVKKLFMAVFVGTFLAIWLQQIAVKLTSAGVAQALLATCPLMGTCIAVRRGYSQPIVVWLGLLLGVSGICMLFLF